MEDECSPHSEVLSDSSLIYKKNFETIANIKNIAYNKVTVLLLKLKILCVIMTIAI